MFDWPLNIGLWKYWNFQREATWRFIAIVTTHNAFSFKYSKWQRRLYLLTWTTVLSYLPRKRNILLKKTKYIKPRNLLWKKRSFWVSFAERTDTWWPQCSAPMLQITACARTLGWTRKIFLSYQDYWRPSSNQKKTVQIIDSWLQRKNCPSRCTI